MRRSTLKRQTKETSIEVALDLDASESSIAVPDGFFGHMLEALAVHSGLGLRLSAQGDTAVDLHHTVEDTGIVLGEALAAALGDRRGVVRFAHAYVPLDEALSRVVLDLSGRPGLVFNVPFTRAMIGEFDVDLVHEFFQGLVNHAGITLHIDALAGDNSHHQAETVFKAFARALRMAIEADARAADAIPSTKGSL